MRRLVLGVFALSLSSPAAAQPVADVSRTESGEMRSFALNGYELSGGEYWPFVGDAPFQYPDAVLWGFYPDEATSAAISCAFTAYHQLRDLFRANPENLRRVVELGATPRFYLWVNDYSRASFSRSRRVNRLWHWSDGPADYGTGFWKWESTLTQDGECLTPTPAQVDYALEEAIEALLNLPQ